MPQDADFSQPGNGKEKKLEPQGFLRPAITVQDAHCHVDGCHDRYAQASSVGDGASRWETVVPSKVGAEMEVGQMNIFLIKTPGESKRRALARLPGNMCEYELRKLGRDLMQCFVAGNQNDFKLTAKTAQ